MSSRRFGRSWFGAGLPVAILIAGVWGMRGHHGSLRTIRAASPVEALVENTPSPEEVCAGRAAIEAKRRKLDAHGSRSFDQPQAAAAFFLEQRLEPGAPSLPLAHLRAELEELRQREAGQGAGGDSARSGANITWSSIGPGNVGGRTRAIAIDPYVPDTMYAAGVAGGIWKSIDGGASWAAADDLMLNLAVCSLVIDPGDPNVLYAGTGEGYFHPIFVQGLGIFKSTDAGATWNQLPGTVTGVPTGAFNYVNDLVVSPNDSNRIYAGTQTGVWRSLDAGQSWAPILSNPVYLTTPPFTNGCSLGCTDLAIRTDRNPDMLFACFGSLQSDGLFRTFDGGDTWQAYSVPSNQGRMTVAFAPSDNDVVYLLMADNGSGGGFGKLVDVWRADDGGDTFLPQVDSSSLTGPWLLSNLILATGCIPGGTYSQGWYDQAIAVDPVNPFTVWVGGVDMFRSDDGGKNFEIAGYWIFYAQDPPPPYYVHPDHHRIVFHPGYNGVTNQTMYVGNDGGIFRTLNARAATSLEDCPLPGDDPLPDIVWGELNNGYGVTQFYHGDCAKNADVFIGGCQDNGTNRVTSAITPDDWKLIFGGDGGYAAIDPTDSQVMYVEYQNFPTIHKSVDGGDTFVEATTGITDDDGLFITPVAMDQNDPEILWTGGKRPWRTMDGATSWQVVGPNFAGPAQISAIGVAPGDGNVVYLGFKNGYVARTTDGLSPSPTWRIYSNGLYGAWVSSMAVDPFDPDVAYLTYSTYGVPHVLRTENGGLDWDSIDGIGFSGVPDIPAHWIAVRPCNPAQLYVGTELGVFVSDDTGASWAPVNTGLAHTVVEALDFKDDDTLVAFTFGRGAFLAHLDPCPDPPSSYGCGVNPAGSITTTGLPVTGTTLVFEVHDPTGAMGLGAATYLFLSGTPDPAYPCGTIVPGWGLAGPGAPGELLIGIVPPDPQLALQGPYWGGAPVPIPIAIPDDPALVGLSIYAQGVLRDAAHNLGLTEGVELTVGS